MPLFIYVCVLLSSLMYSNHLIDSVSPDLVDCFTFVLVSDGCVSRAVQMFLLMGSAAEELSNSEAVSD